MITPLGQISPGVLFIATKALIPHIQAYISTLVSANAELSAGIDIGAEVALPPNPKDLLDAVSGLIVELPKLLADMPTAQMDVSFSANAEIALKLGLIGIINKTLEPILGALGYSGGGLEAFLFAGIAQDLPGELIGYVTGSERANALILVSKNMESWAAIKTLMAV